MQFTVISTLAFAAQALAAVSFTSFPNNVQVGKPVTLSFTTDDTNTPVRIVLRRGPSNDLKDVATLTDTAKGGSYMWTPSSDLSDGSDYALEIIQGSVFNYGTQFSISGGSASSSSAPSGYSSSSLTTHVPIPLSTGGPTFNKTYGTGNATTYMAPSGTAPLGSAVSAGATGSPNMSNNTSFSSPGLPTPTSGSGSGAGTNGAAGTSAGSAPASTTSGTANGATHVGSSLALILGAVAAFAFLN